jgi:hypothetical protein
MTPGGTITRKDLIEDDALNFGPEFAKKLVPAIEAMDKLVELAKGYSGVIAAMKKSESQQAFLEAKQKERLEYEKVTNAVKIEQTVIKGAEKAKQESIRTRKLELDVLAKEERARNGVVNTIQKEQKTRLEDIKVQKARENAFDKYEKQLASENAKLQTASNMYNKLQIELDKLNNTYKNLATRKAQGATLTKTEEEQMSYLEKRIKQHDMTLKAVDATMGKYQRNIGNYSGAFNPLSNSINQLTREMPAFANSVQTGFMAISNNLPIFFDSMGQIIKQNKELQAQGQPTKSVFNQLAGSVFSWGTALSVGVTLLTVYGKDIVDFLGKISGGYRQLNDIRKDYDSLLSKSQIDSQKEIVTLDLLYEKATNVTVPMKERNLAVKELQKTYPSYFGNMDTEKIKLGEAAEAYDKLRKKIYEYAESKAVLGKLTELASKRLEIEKDYADQMAAIGTSAPLVDEFGNIIDNSEAAAVRISESTNKKLAALQKEIDFYTGKYKVVEDINEKGIKTSKEKTALNFKEIQSIYELKKALLEKSKIPIENELNNENTSFEKRIKLRQDYSKKLIQLIDLETKYQQDITAKKYLEDINQNLLSLKNQEITANQYSINIVDINKRFSNEKAKILTDTSVKIQEIYDNDLKYYGEIQEKELEKKRKTEAEKKEFIEKYNDLIKNSEIEKYLKISENEKNTLEVRQEAFRKYKLLALEELDLKKMQEVSSAILAGKTDEEIKYIIAKYDDLINKLNETKSPLQKFQEQAEASNKAFIKSFQSNFMKDAGFSNLQYLIENFNTLKENGTASALAISEAFQETFNKISEISNITFQKNIANIDSEISKWDEYYKEQIKLAGDDQREKDLITAEAERKRKELEKEKRKEQHKQAIFNKAMAALNVGINTAQAVMAIASTGGGTMYADFGISAGILTAITLGIGAAQLAAVLAAPLPKYEFGTDWHIGGPAMVGEKRPEVILEPGKSPYIATSPQILNLAKGTKVIPSLEQYEKEFGQDSINNMLYNSKGKIENYNNLLQLNFQSKEMVEEMRKTRKAIEKNKPMRPVASKNVDIPHSIWAYRNIKW